MKRRISWILISLICLVFIFAASFYMFKTNVNKLSDESMKRNLQEVTENNYRNTTSFLNKDREQLKGLAYRLATTTNIDEKENVRQILNSVIGYMSYDYLVVYTPQQTFGNDATTPFQNDEQLLTTLQTRESVLSMVGDDQSIGLAVPIYINDQVVAAIQGVYLKENLAHSLNFSIFNNEGYFGILDKDGSFLYRSGNEEVMDDQDNLFNSLEESSFSKPYSLATVQTKITGNKSFYSRYQYENETQIAYFTPLDIDDLYLMSVVPESYLAQSNQAIDNNALWLMGILSGVFLSLLLLIAMLNRRDKKILKNHSDSLDRLINTIPLPIFVIRLDRTIMQMNQAAIAIFKIKKDDYIGKPCCQLNTNICKTDSCAIKKLEDEGEKNVFMEIDDARYLVSTTRIYDEYNHHIGYVEVMQNITEVMNMQKILEERTLELETISQNLLGGVLITSLHDGFKVVRCNQGYLDLIGRKESEVIGNPAISWLAREDAQEVENSIFAQLVDKQTVSLEHMLKTADGSRIWVFLYGRKAMLHDKEVGIWLVINIDERKRAEQSVKLSEEKYRIATDNTENIVVDYDIEKDIMIHNERITQIYNVGQLVHNPVKSIVEAGVIAKESIEAFQTMFDKMRAGYDKVEEELLTINKNNQEIWQHVVFTSIFDDEGKVVRAIGVLHDFTSEKNAVLQYQREAQYRKVTMEDAALYYEADLTDMVFLTGHEELVKRFLTKPTNDFDVIIQLLIDHMVYKDDRELVFNNINSRNLLSLYERNEQKLDFEYQRMLGNQECGWVHCTMHLFLDETTQHIRVIGVIKDIDESKKLELHLMKQAQIDQLTGLYNKMTTEYLIRQYIKEADENQLGAFMIIDLDDFKNINDTFGHAFGDAVLSEVSQQFTKLFNQNEIVGRIGGDEFTVFLKDLSSIHDVEKRASEVCSLFHKAYTEGNNYKVSGSVGIASYPSDGSTFEELYEHADIALYSAKNGGKDNYCIYHASLPQIRSDALMRGIDANAGKQFSENIGEYVLRILYEARNPEMLVEAVLELVSKQFHFSRGYVFVLDENKEYWMNEYEWCSSGTPSQKETLQRTTFGEPGVYHKNFNEDGEFYCQDTKEISGALASTVQQLEVSSFIQFAMKRNDEIIAFVGFDDCMQERQITEDTMAILHTVVMLLDVFVFQKKL